jgi:hypothetical protein
MVIILLPRRSSLTNQRQVLHARIVLPAAEGVATSRIAASLGCST